MASTSNNERLPQGELEQMTSGSDRRMLCRCRRCRRCRRGRYRRKSRIPRRLRRCPSHRSLTAARHVVFAEPDWRGTYLEQAEDRAHRIGQTHPVLVTYLLLQLSEWSTDSKGHAPKFENCKRR
jgi:hypothetical protein